MCSQTAPQSSEEGRRSVQQACACFCVFLDIVKGLSFFLCVFGQRSHVSGMYMALVPMTFQLNSKTALPSVLTEGFFYNPIFQVIEETCKILYYKQQLQLQLIV